MNFKVKTYSLPPDSINTPENPIHHYATHVSATTTINSISEGDFLGLYINVGKTNIHYRISNGMEGTIGRHHYNFFFLPQGSAEFTLLKGDYEALCVHFKKEYIKPMADETLGLSAFLKKVNLRSPALLYESPRLMNWEMVISACDIIADRYAGVYKEMFMKVKYNCLMLAALDDADVPPHLVLAGSDTEDIQKVHDYIMNPAHFPLTVDLLADKFEIDKRKLCEGFKLLFGTTVYQFVMDIKMQTARELLQETDMPVSEISDKLGYKNHPNFTEAFINVHGFPPAKLRKKKDPDQSRESPQDH